MVARMSARRLNPSIDEMARDARVLAGTQPKAWAAKFRALLACYGWRVEREGRVYFVDRPLPKWGSLARHVDVVLEDWIITRDAEAR